MDLLIHDLDNREWNEVKDKYEGFNVIKGTDDMRPCIGCFHCWTGGSGECIFKDGFHRMCALIHEADEMVVMSRYTCGGFSSTVKGVFDRCIGYVLPEFEVAYGEMHHRKRFPEEKLVTFIFRGHELSEDDKEKAKSYAHALCRNLRGSVKDVIFEEWEGEERKVFSASPERSGILVVNTSLRGKRSNTGIFLEHILKSMDSEAEVKDLSINGDLEGLAEDIGRAKVVVFGAPLYVDGLPAYAVRLMEKIKEKGTGKGLKLYAVVNNGLYESRQNVNMLSMIKDFCKDIRAEYMGASAIGAGELVGTLMRSRDLWPTKNARLSLERLAKAIESGTKTEDMYADPYLFPRNLYISIANTNWQRLKKKDKQA